jgi:outer membrane receptor protein involved in Fe transport
MNRLFLSTIFIFAGLVTPTIHSQESKLVLEEVVVTANKKEENVQDIAQTVNAVSGATLDDYQIRDLAELSQIVSGVEFTQVDPRRQTITMRGQKVDPDGGNDQPIQVYLDEVPVRTGVAFYQMYDMERVEVLKGAQGTLQGVVSIGGAIQMYSRSATVGDDARNGYVKTTFADNNMSILEFATDLPISSTMSMRIAGATNSNDGKGVKNIRTNVNESHQFDSYRLSLSWEPSDDLSIRLKYQNNELDSIAPRVLAGSPGPVEFDAFKYVAGMSNPFFPPTMVNGPAGAAAAYKAMVCNLAPANCASLTFFRIPRYDDLTFPLKPEDGISVQFHDPRQNNSGDIINLAVDYDMGSHLLAVRYSDYQNDIQGMIDRDYVGGFAFGYPQEVRTNVGIETFEARISNQDDGALEYTLGFFSRNSETLTNADLELSFYATEQAPGVLKSITPFTYDTPYDACLAAGENPLEFAAVYTVFSCVEIPLNNKTEAFFANFKYNLSDKTFVSVGFREQEISSFKSQQLYLPITGIYTAARGGGLTIEQIPAALQKGDTDSTTGNVRVGHYIEDDVLLYYAYETGFRSPGATITPTAVAPSLLLFDEEDTTMTEIGLKGTFLDGRLRLNLAYYDYSFDGYQRKWDNITARSYTATGPGPLAQIQGGLFNNNDASLSGFDIEYQYIVNEDLVIGGSYTSHDSEFDTGSVGYINDPSYSGLLAASKDVTGEPLNDAAETTMTFYLDHTVPAYWGGERYTRYNISWRDARRSTSNPDLTIGELTLANIYFGWRSTDGMWDASLFVKNMLNEVDLSYIQSYYSDYSIFGGSSIGSKFYEGSANMGKQVGFQLSYRF